MKFTATLFAAGAAASLVERQSSSAAASAIVNDVVAIESAVASLDTAIKGITGPSDTSALVSDSQAVVSAINKATSDSNAAPTLTEPEGLAIASPVASLGPQVSSTIDDLIAKKGLIAGYGLCGTVLSQVEAQQSAASAFVSAITTKLPMELQVAVPALAGPINSALASASSAYASCPAATTSASVGTTSTPAGTTSTPAGTSSVATSSAVVPPGYSTSSSSVWTTSSTPCPSSSAVSTATGTGSWTPSSNVTGPSVPTTSVVVSTGGAEKLAAGFGAVVMALLVAAL